MNTLWQDIRYGARMLLKRPGFTAIAVITLALGIGANTAIFSVINSVLLKPLPYAEPGSLVAVWSTSTRERQEGTSSFPNFQDWREQTRSFEGMAAYRDWDFTLNGMGEARRVTAMRVTAGFFPLLGVSPAAGRNFLEEEEAPGSERVAIISYGFWQRDFGGDRGALGRQLLLNMEPYTIVGILPRGFSPPPGSDPADEVYTTIAGEATDLTHRGASLFQVLGRLQPGVSLQQAQTDIETVAGNLAREYPNSDAGTTAYVVGLHQQQVGKIQTALWILFAAVGVVLLIACSNVANLLLARAAARQKEMAIRAALGAGRWRIVRQLLTESLILSAMAGVVGVLLAFWGVDTLVALAPQNLPRLGEVRADASVFGFALLLSMLTGILFGLAPALKASRPELEETLREGSRGSTAGRNRQRLRGLLIVSETALALVLLVCAGLLVKSFVRLVRVDPGFNPENVLTLSVVLPAEKYNAPQRVAFVNQALDRLRAVPAVREAAFVGPMPFSGADSHGNFKIVGRPEPMNAAERPISAIRSVTPDYFRVMGIPLRAGRFFDARDRKGGSGAAIVNEALAHTYWPDQNPVGQRIRGIGINMNGDEPLECEIVGVVGDVHHSALDQKPEAELYVPHEQNSWRRGRFVVRTSIEPAGLATALRREVMSVDKDQPVSDVEPLAQLISESVAPPRFYMTLLGVFSAVGLALGLVGIYGVVSYAVTERTHEIGVRLALGATPADVLRLMIRHGMFFALAGISLGIVGALAATRYLSALLFGVTATDSFVFAGVALLLAAIALLACYIPARRATKVDPLVALRYE